MVSAATRFLCFALLLLGGAAARAADNHGRVTPSRPSVPPAALAPNPRAPLAAKKLHGIDYVNVGDAAVRLGLKMATFDRGKRVVLSAPALRAELESNSRGMLVNGLRVFLGEPVADWRGELYLTRIDFERCLTPLLRPGFGVPTPTAPKTIVLDPGHGGRDHGTSAKEKIYTLDVARRAKKILEGSGHRVVMTRNADVALDLPQRAAIANAQRADLFASIHFNALPNDRKTSGIEIFTFAPQFQRSTNSWAPRQGKDGEKELSPVNRYDHWSVALAHALQRRFVTGMKNFDRGKKLAHWGVLRGLNCPGVLIECGFLTSDVEARKIATPEYRQKLAEALATGIRDYIGVVNGARGRGATAGLVAGDRSVR